MISLCRRQCFEHQMHLVCRLLSVCRKKSVRLTDPIMQLLVDGLKWFGVEASGLSVTVCLFLLFLSLLYWWVKWFDIEVSSQTLFFTDSNGSSYDQWWKVCTIIRSKQLRLVFFLSGTGRNDLIKFQSHVSLHLSFTFFPVCMQTVSRLGYILDSCKAKFEWNTHHFFWILITFYCCTIVKTKVNELNKILQALCVPDSSAHNHSYKVFCKYEDSIHSEKNWTLHFLWIDFCINVLFL